MTETEIETPETEEHVENPAAVLKKNRELLADLAKLKDRTASLEDLARDFGVDDAALSDPAATVAKRGEERKATEERNRTVRTAALTKIAAEGRVVTGDLDEILAKVASDPKVTIADGKVTGLDEVLAKIAPKRAAPGPPDTRMRAEDAKPVLKTWEELQALGYTAVSRFATERPEKYRELREEFERRLARPERRG